MVNEKREKKTYQGARASATPVCGLKEGWWWGMEGAGGGCGRSQRNDASPSPPFVDNQEGRGDPGELQHSVEKSSEWITWNCWLSFIHMIQTVPAQWTVCSCCEKVMWAKLVKSLFHPHDSDRPWTVNYLLVLWKSHVSETREVVVSSTWFRPSLDSEQGVDLVDQHLAVNFVYKGPLLRWVYY